MKKLAEECGIVKVDALNCIDCQLGGKGVFLEVDPQQDLMFLSPGVTDFFSHAQELVALNPLLRRASIAAASDLR